MSFTIDEILVGVIIIIFILIITFFKVDHFIIPQTLFIGFIIILIVGGRNIMLKSNISKSSEKRDLVLDGQTKNVLRTSNKKSVDGKQVSFEEKIVTTTVTNESMEES